MTEGVADTARRRPRGRRWTALLLQLLLALALVLGIWFSFKASVLDRQGENAVPERLGALELVTFSEGPEALAEVNKLHGADIELVSAYIAQYAHQGEQAKVWVSRAESAEAAEELTARMVREIENGNGVFANLVRISVSGQDVFQVQGPGGENFFYNSRKAGEMVVWLTIKAADTLAVVEQAVKTF